MNAKDYARKLVDSRLYRETGGPNRGPALNMMADTLGFPHGLSWCAIFQSYVFKLARDSGEQGIAFHPTAGSQDLLGWFTEHGWTSHNPQDTLHWKGALIIRTDPGGEHGHVALVESRFTDDHGTVVSLGTLEGNTDVHGGSNGDGAYARVRPVPLAPYVWTYCNTSLIAGGSWW